MQNQLISVLIPFKNTELYVSECIQSVIDQTEPVWELIAVDDGSTDDSFQIVEQFAKTDKRISVFKNPKQGLIHALQFAYSKSSGGLITRMDSDDIMSVEKFKIMKSELLKYGNGYLATGLVKYFSESGINSGYFQYEQWLNSLILRGANFSEIYKECTIPSPCWMVSRTDFEVSNGFNSSLYPEDYDLAFRFYKSGLKCIPSNDLLHYWRDYGTRTSRTDSKYSHDALLDIKVHYFLEIELNKSKTLILWGAGHKGKRIAKTLIEKNIAFDWICDNPKKIGKHIYDKELYPFEYLKQVKSPQSIITVANKFAQKEIIAHLKSWQLKPMKDYFFFC